MTSTLLIQSNNGLASVAVVSRARDLFERLAPKTEQKMRGINGRGSEGNTCQQS